MDTIKKNEMVQFTFDRYMEMKNLTLGLRDSLNRAKWISEGQLQFMRNYGSPNDYVEHEYELQCLLIEMDKELETLTQIVNGNIPMI